MSITLSQLLDSNYKSNQINSLQSDNSDVIKVKESLLSGDLEKAKQIWFCLSMSDSNSSVRAYNDAFWIIEKSIKELELLQTA